MSPCTEPEIVATLVEGGADASRIVLGHMDVEISESKLRRVAELGTYVELDQFGFPAEGLVRGRRIPSDSDRIAMIQSLIDWGAEDRILLSHDVCTRNQWRRWGGNGFAHLGRSVRPLLLDAVDESLTDKLLWLNPARMLSVGARAA